MADQSPIAQLAAKPLNYQIGVLVGIMVISFGLYYQLYYSSMGEDLESAKSSYNRAETKNRELQSRELEWKQMLEDQKSLDLKLSVNQVSLPQTAALPSFIGHLQRQAAVSGVSFKNWSRLPEVPVAGYVKVPVKVEVIGKFHQVLKYYYLLGDPGKTKRIITVEDFSMSPDTSEEDEVLLKAEFRAVTFRQADGAVPPPMEEAKSGMINKAKDARAKKEGQVEAVTGGKTDEQGNPVPASGVDRLKNPGAK